MRDVCDARKQEVETSVELYTKELSYGKHGQDVKSASRRRLDNIILKPSEWSGRHTILIGLCRVEPIVLLKNVCLEESSLLRRDIDPACSYQPIAAIEI